MTSQKGATMTEMFLDSHTVTVGRLKEPIEAKIEHAIGEMLTGHIPTDAPTIPDISGANKEFRPIVRKTVAYIVSAVVFNMQNTSEVLMIQESKPESKGSWYLPAGKIKEDESLEEGVVREVLKSTGYSFRPTSLLTVEVCGGHWYRFTFAGEITGGYLKTRDQRSEESIQARWFPVQVLKEQKILKLRNVDILPVIEVAQEYQHQDTKHPPCLPVKRGYNCLIYRMVLVHFNDNQKRVHVLIDKKPQPHFPSAAINPDDMYIHQAKDRIIQEIFGTMDIRTSTVGVLVTEHTGKPGRSMDGMCLTVMVATWDEKLLQDERYMWVEIKDGDLAFKFKEKIEPGKVVQLLDLR